MRSPIKNGRIHIGFWKYGPARWRWLSHHTGVDLICPTGTPILATSDQTVIRADHNGGSYGRWVAAKDSRGRIHIYAHMSKVATKVGAKVHDGTIIGYVGSTGNSSGPHLHYEVRNGATGTAADRAKYGQWGRPINPTPWCK